MIHQGKGALYLQTLTALLLSSYLLHLCFSAFSTSPLPTSIFSGLADDGPPGVMEESLTGNPARRGKKTLLLTPSRSHHALAHFL